jgi:DNA uptake protein ComE-like DNA-binding protein
MYDKQKFSFFMFSSQQKKGILMLFLIIIALQLFYFFSDFSQTEKKYPEKESWLALQSEIDSLRLPKYEKPKLFSFNPNFISDYRGYKLGMSTEEIDRLLAFRKENKYVNSAEEFQNVTKVSDSLLRVLSPYFKFPDWIQNKKSFKKYDKAEEAAVVKKIVISALDINMANKEDLMKVRGIGEALSNRILERRASLDAFVSIKQLNEIWGLSPEVVEELQKYFRISSLPDIKKIPVNTASLKELSQFPYFKYALAKQIITYRSMNGNITDIKDMINIKGFPVEKADIIALYLEF